MPVTLSAAIWLRIAALLVLPACVVLAAILERGLASVAGLALAMTAGHALARGQSGLAALSLERRLVPTLLTVFATRLVLSLALFVIAVGILALFRETELARSVDGVDAWLVLGGWGVSLILGAVSARLIGDQVREAEAMFRSTDALFRRRGPASRGSEPEDTIIDADYREVPGDETDPFKPGT